MSTPSTLILLGVLIMVFPYLGLPHAWSNLFLLVFGVGVFGIGFMLRARAVRALSTHASAAPTPIAPEHHEPSNIS